MWCQIQNETYSSDEITTYWSELSNNNPVPNGTLLEPKWSIYSAASTPVYFPNGIFKYLLSDSLVPAYVEDRGHLDGQHRNSVVPKAADGTDGIVG